MTFQWADLKIDSKLLLKLLSFNPKGCAIKQVVYDAELYSLQVAYVGDLSDETYAELTAFCKSLGLAYPSYEVNEVTGEKIELPARATLFDKFLNLFK